MRQMIQRAIWAPLLAAVAAGCGQNAQAPPVAEAVPTAAGESAPTSAPTSQPMMTGQVITLGVAAPFSGDVAQFGASIRKGADLMVEEVNARGGIRGAMIKLVYENDGGNPQEAAIVARKLANNPEVVAVVGHFNSSCSLAGKPIYRDVGVLQFSPASTNPRVTKDSEWTFRNIYDDDFQGYSLAHYVHDKLHLQSVGVFYDNDDYGIGLKSAFIKEAEILGVRVVGQESYERDTVDFTPQLVKLASAKPDAIMIGGLYTQAAQIAGQARRMGMTALLLGADGLHSIDLIKIGGEATEGMLITVPFLMELGDDNTKAFVDKFTAKYNEDPDSWSALTYDAVGTILTAIERVGTDRRAIRDAVAAMNSPETAYHGVTGLSYFDSEGDTAKAVHVATVKDGAFVPAELQLLD